MVTCYHHGIVSFGTLAYVKRTTVKISDELDAKLRHEAARRGQTISEVTRVALEEYLGVRGRRRLLAAAAGRSHERDVARRIEEIVAREWSEEHDRGARR